MTRTAKPTSISISQELNETCKRFCDKYSIKFSTLVRRALLKYLNDVKVDSEELLGLSLWSRLQQLDDTIVQARKYRNATIRDGSGVREARELRVTGQLTKGFKPYQTGREWIPGQIVDQKEREIYDKYSDIIDKCNKERIMILQNPIFVKLLTSEQNKRTH